jgi:pseudouridine kinase
VQLDEHIVMPIVPPGARVVVVGGANTDVIGVSAAVLVARDSNPGRIRTSPGGVGRNVAENLVRMGVAVELVSAFGDDEAGRALMASCRARGIGVSASLLVADLPGAHYLAVLDERHDMAVAVNDMRVLDRLTPDALAESERVELLLTADLVVVDANLSVEAIEWLAGVVRAPMVLEPVSAAKVARAAGVVSRFAAVTPNPLEAAVLLGHEVAGLDGALQAARELVGLGVGAAFVTCGAEGTAWADAGASGLLPAPGVEIANASGAGDAFCAGVAFALLARADAHSAGLLGTALAGFALADEDTVSRDITRVAAFEAMKELES